MPFFGRVCLPHGGHGLSDRRNRRKVGELSPDPGRRGQAATGVDLDKELAEKFDLGEVSVRVRDVGVQAGEGGGDVDIEVMFVVFVT